MSKLLPTVFAILIVILCFLKKRDPSTSNHTRDPSQAVRTLKANQSPKTLTKLAASISETPQEQTLPANCHFSSSDDKSATCSPGYYKALHNAIPGKVVCCSCSKSINHCLQCSSSSLEMNKGMLCQKCSFSYLPSGDFTSCQLRAFFFIYVSLYTAVTIILVILSSLEMRQKKCKNLDVQADFNKGDCSFDAEAADESIDCDQGKIFLFNLKVLFYSFFDFFFIF